LNESSQEDFFREMHISEVAQKCLTCYGWDSLNHRNEDIDAMEGGRFIGRLDSSGSCTIETEPRTYNFETIASSTAIKLELARDCVRRLTSDEVLKLSLAERKDFEKKTSDILDSCLLDVSISFSERTQAMIRTLQKVEELRKSGAIKGKVFLIAGRKHLKEDEPPHPFFTLKPFYEALQSLPSAVVAFPKEKVAPF
jgi:hypothetical protein